MDKKYIERPKKFNRYEYAKQHYRQIKVEVKPEIKERIDNYCKEAGISKAEFLRQAIDLFEMRK